MTRSADLSASRVPSVMRESSVCPSTAKIVLGGGDSSVLELTLTAMATCAPIAFTTSAGTLFRAPPSTSRRLSSATGVKAAGIDIVARSARANEPEPRTTASPARMSVATQRNGVGRSSNVCTP